MRHLASTISSISPRAGFRAVAVTIYYLLSTICFLGPAAADPFSAYPNHVTVRIVNPELAAMTGLASVKLNLGELCRPDGADLIVLDSHRREQASLIRSISPDGEIELVFQCLADPVGPYEILSGKPDARRPDYRVDWNLGRVISDDDLPAQARSYGLWEWCRKPCLAGVFSHTTPIPTGSDIMTYHGTAAFSGFVPKSKDMLNQCVYLDPKDPPTQLLMRLVFESPRRENPWDYDLVRIDCNWGRSEVHPEPASRNWNRLGDLPAPGKWTRLSINLSQLISHAEGLDSGSGSLPPLYGIEFYTDKGRAYWDMTTLGDVPAPAEITSLSADSKSPAFLCQTVRALRLEGSTHPFTVVRFVPSVPSTEPVLWDFGDGSTSTDWSPAHLFTGVESATVTMKLPRSPSPSAVSRVVAGLDNPLRPTRFALDLVSVPKVVAASDDVLFNLRLEGTYDKLLPALLVVSELDEKDAVLSSDARPVEVLPAPDHPVNVTVTRKLSDPRLRRLSFALVFMDRTLVSTSVEVRDSASTLEGIRLLGDVFVDVSARPVVIRTCIHDTSLAAKPRPAAARILVIGDVPTLGDPFSKRLETALASSGIAPVKVLAVSVPESPSWSLPWRELISVVNPVNPAQDPLRAFGEVGPDLIIVALNDRLLLAGLSHSDAVSLTSAVVEALRRRTDVPILLATPIPYTGFEREAREYAVALKDLALARSLPIADFYSCALRTIKDFPHTPDTLVTQDGVRRHRIPDELLTPILDALVPLCR